LKVDYLVAEIGSTTTVVTAFDKVETETPLIIGQAEHYTTIKENDVTIGIDRAIKKLEEKLGESIQYNKLLACSSAAGGLKMTVHGLVYDMTVRAAKEAALGAGAVLKYATAGKMRSKHIEEIKNISPNVILLAGGVDYGEEEVILHNAEILSKNDSDAPIIYAGNTAIKEEVKDILEKTGKKVIITENVYPKVDQLNVEYARHTIQHIFSKHIIHAPGMSKIYEKVDEEVIPTPGAVMLTTELLAKIYKDVATVDIGGATTDVDSVTLGDPEIQRIMISPEPESKRTVEGDLGLYVNAKNVVEMLDKNKLLEEFPDYEKILETLTPYPENDRQEKFCAYMAKYCFSTSLIRHCGNKKDLFTPNGKQEIASGKDLTAVKYVFGTGGILSRSKYKKEIMESMFKNENPKLLLPNKKVKFAYDKNYIFAAIGVISTVNEKAALNILKNNIEFI
jgi:uncharacterized protein (TIGR01319 family)